MSLVGFGFDSAIEVAAAAMVLHRLRAELRGGEIDEGKERRALKFIALTFFSLAIYVAVEGIINLTADETPDTSTVGLVLLALSIVVMPWLARAKGVAGETIGSRLMIA